MAEEGGTAPAAPEESSAEAAVTEEAAAEQTEKPGKASKGSKPAATLADAFKLHASKGSGSEATSADVNKWCKDAGIFGKTCDSGHVDISFTKCKQKTAKNMTFAEMDAFMEELAKKFKDDHKLDEDAAKQQIAQKLTKTKPKSHGTTKAAKGGATGRLTDVKGYTGFHKERFDADTGKGKGKEGRADVSRNTGYVGNYKNEGTYGGGGKKSSSSSSGKKK